MIDALFAALNRILARRDLDEGFDCAALMWTYAGEPVLALEDFHDARI